MHVKLLVFLIPLIVIGFLVPNAYAQVKLDPVPDSILDNGVYKPYKLLDNANTVTVLSNKGSLSFDKNSCAASFYNNTNGAGQPIIGSQTYSVLASQGNTGIWNPVSIINNAACVTSITENNGVVTISGTKSVTGAGVFTVQYTKQLYQGFKETLIATNNNPAWTNFHIGASDSLQVPRFINLGNTTYDLSQQNNTVLSRAWITSHQSQLIKFASNAYYDMGIGWNNANDITIHWINNKATLTIDYTFNTPILSPGQTITVDPSITLDTSVATGGLSGGGTNATQNISITIGANSNRMIVVTDQGLVQNCCDRNNAQLSSVKIGSLSFTRAVNKTGTYAGVDNAWSEIWYLVNPPTGAVHITLTPASTTGGYYLTAGAYSLYNVKQTAPIGNTNSTSGATATSTIEEVPTATTSWLIDSMMLDSTPAFNSNTDVAIYETVFAGAYDGASQYRSAPTAGHNALTYVMAGAANWRSVIAEIILGNNIPSTPTLTHANTLNSTSIKLDWPSVTGATWYVIKQASPYTGVYSQIANQSSNTLTVNSLTAGTQYGFKVQAGNSSGGSADSGLRSNYTKNIAPTSPVISLTTASQGRVTVTNPSGNFSGYLVYQVQGNGANYTLAGTSSNTTNKFDITGLNGNTKHTVKLSTRYAVGTNSSGTSSNSTTATFYTLPNPPTSPTLTQYAALSVRLSWTAPTDNGTATGYEIERSTGGAYSILVANTGNSTTHYDDIVSTSGTYFYKVHTIKYGGTSVASSIVSKPIWGLFTVNAYHADGVTAVYGNAIQSNSTSKNNVFPLISGSVQIQGISNLNNFTIKNSLISFVVAKQYNYNSTTFKSLNITTNDYNVDCSFTGTGPDIELWTNGTDGHRISFFQTPTCFSNNTVNWKTVFTPNGISPISYNTLVYVKVLNATYLNNATLKWNTTKVTTALSSPYIVSTTVPVGAGTVGTKVFYWSMNLTLASGYIPANFTVGHISISSVNHVTAPITFTANPINSSMTKVIVTFPSTYSMAYHLKLNNAGSTLNYSGITTVPDTPSLGLSQSTFTIKNPQNDTVNFFAYDTLTPNNATFQLAMPVSKIPLVSQIQQFKTGAFGTTAQLGSLDLVTFIVIIVSFIGMNRVNETIGVMMCVIIIGVMSFFGLIAWPTTMVSAIALVVLVTVTSTKKLPWS